MIIASVTAHNNVAKKDKNIPTHSSPTQLTVNVRLILPAVMETHILLTLISVLVIHH